jgi:hypothetical protein
MKTCPQAASLAIRPLAHHRRSDTLARRVTTRLDTALRVLDMSYNASNKPSPAPTHLLAPTACNITS